MSSNNLDEKALLEYISRSLANWGITHIDTRTLRRAKENSQEAIQPLTRLLLDLVILHCFDYAHPCDQLALTFHSDHEMQEIILAHLYQIHSPFVVELAQNAEGETHVGLDFSSSRHLLLACGWLMAVSNFFNHTLDLFRKKFNAIYKPKALDLHSLGSKYVLPPKSINLHEGTSKIDRISFLAKTLRARNHSLQCLIQKKHKIMDRLRANLKQIDDTLTLQDFLGTCSSTEIEQHESQLKEMIGYEKKNMGYRKYWWIWLDVPPPQPRAKSSPSTTKNSPKPTNTSKNYSTPRKESAATYASTSPTSPGYFEASSRHAAQLEEIEEKMRVLQLKERKKYKEVQQDVLYQLRQAREAAMNSRDVLPSFLALQLKKYLQLQEAVPQTSTKHPSKKGKDRQQAKLTQQIKQFISQIEDIVII